MARRRGGGGYAAAAANDDIINLVPGLPDAPDPLDYADGVPSQPGHGALEGLLAAGVPSGSGDPSAGGGGSLNQQRGGPPGSGAGPRIDPATTASDLSSVQELLAEVEGGAHQGLIEILRGHTFVGMVSRGGTVSAEVPNMASLTYLLTLPAELGVTPPC